MSNFFQDDPADNLFDGYEFSKILKEQESVKLLKNSVDFYGIFGVIYQLFEELGVLNESTVSSDKISFKFAYPDYKFEDSNENIVIFELASRTKLKVNSVTQEKARELHSGKDIITGQIKSHNSFSFDNKITISVFASSSEREYQILKFLETAFLRYKGYFKSHFKEFRYDGMQSTAIGHNLYKNRMFCKILYLTIHTEEVFELLHEEIKEINIQHGNPNLLKG